MPHIRSVRPAPLQYSSALEAIRSRSVRHHSYQAMVTHLEELRLAQLPPGLWRVQEVRQVLLSQVTADWLAAIHPKLLPMVYQEHQAKLLTSPLHLLQPLLANSLPTLLARLPEDPSLQLVEQDEPASSPGSVETLPHSSWLPVLRLLSLPDLAAVCSTCRHLGRAASAPSLWRGMRLRQAVLLLHGLPHLLASQRYREVTTLDFSQSGLGTQDLELLLRFCLSGHLQVRCDTCR